MQVKIFIALSSLLVSVVFVVGGYFLHGIFGDAQTSSFLGVVIATNTSIVFRRVRQWLFKFFYNNVCARIAKLHRLLKGVITDSEIDYVYNFAAMSLSHFKNRIDKLTTIAVFVCFAIAVFTAMLYWVGVPDAPGWIKKGLHILLLPPTIYYTSTVVCCLCMMDSCNEHFGEYEAHALKLKTKDVKGTKDLEVESKFQAKLTKFSNFKL